MRVLILVICLFAATLARAEMVFPVPQGYVNDYANMLSRDQEVRLESRLRQFDQQTTNQVVVATFNSLEGQPLESFSMQLAKQWKIGSKKNDNGVLLLIIKNDRKVRIEVGYGLEGALTDAISSSIIRNQIAPSFKNNDYNTGIQKGVAAIFKATKGEYQPVKIQETDFYNTIWFWIFIIIMIVFISYGYARQHGIKIPILETIYLIIALVMSQQNKRRFPDNFSDFKSGGGSGNGDNDGGFKGGGGRFGGGGASGGW